MSESPASVRVQWFEVGEEGAGQRIDNYLMARLKGVPRSHVYRILRTGEVRRNGGRVQADVRLAFGDRIRVPPVKVAQPAQATPLNAENIRKRFEARILFEDDDIIAFNKPAGVAVHGGSGLAFGVIEGFREIRPEARFLELVHRLDRDTSGCLLLAKKRSALSHLHQQFREDTVNKRYLALFVGAWRRASQTVDAPLQKNILQSGERMVKVSPQGKPARTDFRRLEAFTEATLVEALPMTGRTHQIRVHAKHLGHPLAGDERYGDEDVNRQFRQSGLKRLFLHAAEAGFQHPRTGATISVSAPLEPDLQSFLTALRK